MDDISREPLPEPSRPRSARARGPAELVRMEEALQEDGIEALGADVRVVPLDDLDQLDADPAVVEFGAREPLETPEEPARDVDTGREQESTAAEAVGSGGGSAADTGGAKVAATPSDVDDETVELEAAVSEVEQTEMPSPSVRVSVPGSESAPQLSDPEEIARVAMAALLTQREGLSVARLAEVCNTTKKELDGGLEALGSILRTSGLPLEVASTGDGVRLLTVPDVFPYLRRLRPSRGQERISPAALETLAVIAYRQPVIRAEIESIRGVKAGPVLRWLLEHKLVDVVGRAEVPGKPLQYGTTATFLERFGLGSLADLPSVREFQTLQ